MDYIAFPGLGLKFNIDSVAFTVMGKDIYWYGIIIALGFALAIIICSHLAGKNGLNSDVIVDFVLYAAPLGIIGARLYYVIFEWDYYKEHLADIVKIWNGGLAIYGGIITAIAVAVVYARVKKINLGLLCDIGSVGLLIGQMVGRWGNFVNQEAFGTNTTLPWGMTGNEIKEELGFLLASGVNVDPNVPVHPTFLYESLWNLVFLSVFIALFSKRRFNGEIFASYLISYGTGRFFIESLRTDSLMAGNFRISQMVALLCIIAGIVLLVRGYKKIKGNF